MRDKTSLENVVILITRERMNTAVPELQQKVLGTYLQLLLENGSLPAAICLYTDRVMSNFAYAFSSNFALAEEVYLTR